MIQMYHGDESQHLIIFVNGEIVQIAFHQNESETYSFMIEQQLLELDITHEEDSYSYSVTPQVPTPIENPSDEGFFTKQFWIPLIILLLILNLGIYLYKSVFSIG